MSQVAFPARARQLHLQADGWPRLGDALPCSLLGLVLGVKLALLHRAAGLSTPWWQALSTGLMEGWLWFPIGRPVVSLAHRLARGGVGRLRVLALHCALAPIVSTGQLLAFATVSSVYRSLTFGVGFRIDYMSAFLGLFARGLAGYGILVFAAHALRRARSETAAFRAEPPQDSPLAFGQGRRRVFLRAREISHVRAAGNYLELHGEDGVHLVRQTMAAAEARLGDGFVRIHRSTLVRRDAILRIERGGSGGPSVVLRGGEHLSIGRTYREGLEGP